jgi:hypothetical protein
MRMKHLWLVWALWWVASPVLAVVEDSSTTTPSDTQDQEMDQTTSAQESEAKGIIPDNADTLVSTQPITPISTFPEKAPYDEATAELLKALELWNSGHAEAASDTALEAYDDLISLHRVPGVKRAKIRAQIRQAAGVYVEGGIAYIKNYVKQQGGTPDALAEGKSRLEDLRDVAKNYLDLNRMLQTAIDQLPATVASQTK